MTYIINEAVTTVLTEANLNDEQVYRLLAPVGFDDWVKAYRCLYRIPKEPEARQLFKQTLPHLLTVLSESANPDPILVNFERLTQNMPDQMKLFQHLANNPRIIEILVTLFTGSQFLTEILLRDPRYFERLTTHHQLTQPKTLPQLVKEAEGSIATLITHGDSSAFVPALDAMRRFQRWELLRIGASDLLASFDLPTVTAQLSHLTDALTQAGLKLASAHTNIAGETFFVVAMGKLGGNELNYSSDIDLLFLCEKEAVQHYRLGQYLIDALNRTTNEGFLYRVDMRLRPWGRSGPLVSTMEAYLKYLHQNARLWEKQALLKARVIAGNIELGNRFIQQIQPHLFGTSPETIRTEVHSLKQRIEAQLKKKGRDWGEVKLGAGSIRDIEFVTQYLQLAHGGQIPHLRSSNTLQALRKLFTAKLLTPAQYRVLVDGYVFLRTIEHHLQLMHYRQTHTLPDEEVALDHLGHRLGFTGHQVGRRFVNAYQQHSKMIRVVYQQILGDEADKILVQKRDGSPDVLPHLVRMHPSYTAVFSDMDIEYHATLMLSLSQEHPVIVDAKPLTDGYWQVTIVGYDYLGVLSVICGLMFVYDLNIYEGHVFSYGPSIKVPSSSSSHPRKKRKRPSSRPIKPTKRDTQRKIVDVFTIKPEQGDITEDRWAEYTHDLRELVLALQAGNQWDAQGELAKRVAEALNRYNHAQEKLYPIDIEIDNQASQRHTVLNIDTPDTIGFLYIFTNALSFINIDIRRMTVETRGTRVADILYVTDAGRQKITDDDKHRELRVATALIKQFTYLLPSSPNPEAALLHFREFVAHLFSQPHWHNELASLEQPAVMHRLARLLGVSDFLWNDFLRMQYDNLFPVLKDDESLAEHKTKDDVREALQIELLSYPLTTQQRMLNEFKDREMFRIDMRQIMGYITEFGQFSSEITDLAEIIVETAYSLASREIRMAHGLPRLENGHACPATICTLGKTGGREMGFASDIELMFIYGGNGRTTGRRVITTAEYFNKIVYKVNDIIKTKQEGIFELDLRLRPYGTAGSMGVSLESFERYFAPDGDAWPYERQALVKLRPIAGDMKLGRRILKLRDSFIYNGQPFDAAAMRAMRERQLRHSVKAGTINAKLSLGALVDIEYLVQGLQITYGHRSPSLRNPNTRKAMTALAHVGIIPMADYQPLLEALNFLRQLINALRMVRGNTKDLTVPPADSDAFAFLARRLNYGRNNTTQLQEDLTYHMTNVQEINQRLLA